eukprot:363457-Chlamydomonas_euryale.AAC.1
MQELGLSWGGHFVPPASPLHPLPQSLICRSRGFGSQERALSTLCCKSASQSLAFLPKSLIWGTLPCQCHAASQPGSNATYCPNFCAAGNAAGDDWHCGALAWPHVHSVQDQG